MTNNNAWDESKHPRDEEGKFTYKNGGDNGVIKGSIEKTVNADSRIKNNSGTIPYGDNEEQTKEILLDALKTVLEKLKTYPDLDNNIDINRIFKTTNNIHSNNKTDNIKLLSHNISLSNNRNNITTGKINTNSIDRINNPNKTKLGFGVLQPKKQRNIEDILYPTMADKEPIIKNNRYRGIELTDTTKIKERPIEDILYPTMKDIKKIEIPRENAGDYETVGSYPEKKDGRIHWISPLTNWVEKSKYGMRPHPIFKEIKLHDGIDMGVPLNTPVMAVDDGVIVYSGWKGGYGNYIEIDHGGDLHSFYGHLNKINVSLGDKIYQGDVIGLSGNTGYSTGPHLHFGVHKGKKPDDPKKYLP